MGGAVDWIRSKKNGLLVAPDNPKTLSIALRWMAENKDKLEPMGALARETVSQSLSLDVLIGQLEQLYLC